MRPVVCGFEPFGGRRSNRSWDAVRRLATRVDVETAQLPVAFDRLPEVVRELVARRPPAMLLVGEARRAMVTVEALALNVMDSHRPDNAGRRTEDEPLVPDGALARRADWSAPAVVAAIRATGVRAESSFHAGTYCCNAALYLALAAAGGDGPRVGFVHVPAIPWPKGPSDEALATALAVALDALGAPR